MTISYLYNIEKSDPGEGLNDDTRVRTNIVQVGGSVRGRMINNCKSYIIADLTPEQARKLKDLGHKVEEREGGGTMD
ncbi:MAG: hypothetical protein PHU12_01590 [Candidatus Aenigmarchaeota archaeon]|nr:hypothetical protein [Candidatus Aenigmarchaeota archaeon]